MSVLKPLRAVCFAHSRLVRAGQSHLLLHGNHRRHICVPYVFAIVPWAAEDVLGCVVLVGVVRDQVCADVLASVLVFEVQLLNDVVIKKVAALEAFGNL